MQENLEEDPGATASPCSQVLRATASPWPCVHLMYKDILKNEIKSAK